MCRFTVVGSLEMRCMSCPSGFSEGRGDEQATAPSVLIAFASCRPRSVPARCGNRFEKSSDSLRRTPPTSP